MPPRFSATVRGFVGDVARRAASAQARATARILRQDYLACAAPLRAISETLPPGDTGRRVWMLTSMATVWALKLEGIMSMAARLVGSRPAAVYADSALWPRRYHRLFGIRDTVEFWRYVDRTDEERVPQIEEFVRGPLRNDDLLDLTYRNVDVGRIALSNVLYRNKFARFDLGDPSTVADVVSELRAITRRVRAAERAIADGRPSLAMVLEKGLSPVAELFGACVAAGVDVVQYSGSQNLNDFVLRRFSYDNRQQHPFSLDPRTWEFVKTMPWSADLERELMEGFAEAYQSGSWFRRKYLHEKKRFESAAAIRERLGLDPAKKTAVIFSHVLWDATFFYCRGLFEDYESWLVETVRAACANPRVNWVLKLHPDLVWKLKYEGYTGELRDTLAVRTSVGTLPPHVTLVLPDTDISTYSFFELADYCITVRGTVGIEMACHGVPVLTAGTGRYSGLGFTTDSSTRDEYLQRLLSVERIPPMSGQERELARRFAFALFHLRPWPMRSFELVHRSIADIGHPLVQNVEPRVATGEQFAAAADVRALSRWLDSGAADYLEQPSAVALS